MIENLVKALELANVEAAVVALPEAVISEVTTALLNSWNCTRKDVVGKALLKAGAGPVSARHIDGTSDASGTQQIEITYSHPLGSSSKTVFRAQRWQQDDKQFYVLLAQAGDAGQSEAAKQNERRLNMALRSGGYALWDYNYDTDQSYVSPELLEIFGHQVGNEQMSFKSFNKLIHPEDLDKSLDEKIRKAPFGCDVFQTRYRVKTADGRYAWIESLAGLIRDPVTGKPSKAIGLCRNVDEQMVAVERLNKVRHGEV